MILGQDNSRTSDDFQDQPVIGDIISLLDRAVSGLQRSVLRCDTNEISTTLLVYGPKGLLSVRRAENGAPNFQQWLISDAGLAVEMIVAGIQPATSTPSASRFIAASLQTLRTCIITSAGRSETTRNPGSAALLGDAFDYIRAAANAHGMAGNDAMIAIRPGILGSPPIIKLTSHAGELAKPHERFLALLAPLCARDLTVSIDDNGSLWRSPYFDGHSVRLDVSMPEICDGCIVDPVATLRAMPKIGSGPWLVPA